MAVEEESVLEEAFDAVMEFVGDEDVQRGAGYLVIGGLAIAAAIAVYLVVMMYWHYIVAFIVIVVLIMIFGRVEPTAYCSDCGNILGRGEQSGYCRCGCNRYTYTDPGVGKTVKNR